MSAHADLCIEFPYPYDEIAQVMPYRVVLELDRSADHEKVLWCRVQGMRWNNCVVDRDHVFFFEREQDAALFVLRWA